MIQMATRMKIAIHPGLALALRVLCLTSLISARAPASKPTTGDWHFRYGSSTAPAGVISVRANDLYTASAGFGFEPGAAIIDQKDCCTSGHPFFFSAAVPEGNYHVTVTLGDASEESDNTIRAEARRLMVENVATKKGQLMERTFTVNVRRPEIAGGGAVAIHLRAASSFTWDDKLTLEFNGSQPAIDAIDIEPAPDAIVIFIAGDSTVTDQENEPYTGWGQMLPRFFDPAVSVANYAESGRALYSFRSERRLEKILSLAKKGDYVLIQFGHNDQKDKRPGAGAFTTYKKDLEQYVDAIRRRDATPVLVTPMYRRRFDKDGKLQESLGDYPAAVRKVAAEQKVMLIDLHEMSGMLFQTLGPQETLKAFVHYPANTFPGQTKALADDTHFTSYGAYELARCVIEAIRTSDLPLRKHLAGDVNPFDPSKPDPVAAWKLPSSPLSPAERPEGS
jgi:lysophospholipase L1-like esterase